MIASEALVFVFLASSRHFISTNGFSTWPNFRHIKHGHNDDIIRPGDDVIASLRVSGVDMNNTSFSVLKTAVPPFYSWTPGGPVFVNNTLLESLSNTGRYSCAVVRYPGYSTLQFNITGIMYEDRGNYSLQYTTTFGGGEKAVVSRDIFLDVLGPPPEVAIITGEWSKDGPVTTKVAGDYTLNLTLPVFQSYNLIKSHPPFFGCLIRHSDPKYWWAETTLYIGDRMVTSKFHPRYEPFHANAYGGGLVNISRDILYISMGAGESGLGDYVPTARDHGEVITCSCLSEFYGPVNASAIICTEGKPLLDCPSRWSYKIGDAKPTCSITCAVIAHPPVTSWEWISPDISEKEKTVMNTTAKVAVTASLQAQAQGRYKATLRVTGDRPVLIGSYFLTVKNSFGSSRHRIFVQPMVPVDGTSEGRPIVTSLTISILMTLMMFVDLFLTLN